MNLQCPNLQRIYIDVRGPAHLVGPRGNRNSQRHPERNRPELSSVLLHGGKPHVPHSPVGCPPVGSAVDRDSEPLAAASRRPIADGKTVPVESSPITSESSKGNRIPVRQSSCGCHRHKGRVRCGDTHHIQPCHAIVHPLLQDPQMPVRVLWLQICGDRRRPLGRRACPGDHRDSAVVHPAVQMLAADCDVDGEARSSSEALVSERSFEAARCCGNLQESIPSNLLHNGGARRIAHAHSELPRGTSSDVIPKHHIIQPVPPRRRRRRRQPRCSIPGAIHQAILRLHYPHSPLQRVVVR
mmetsp:Transcript_20020/g.44435  ORF Transcript_20020/g.44435 Transcript_20020/m.44435 type:complete len:298 (+) Transcript_20020:1459-2352(+)